MSDPQDLLYTNNFLQKDVLSEKSLLEDTDYYNRFENYINNNLSNTTENYLSKDLYEKDLINLNKTLHEKWPLNKNKNHYPLFDSYINDISTNRYKKNILTKISIASENRDVGNYPNSNAFQMSLNTSINNVTKIYINDIIFPNLNESFNNNINNLSWQYSSENFLVENNIDYNIIPVPEDNKISYSLLPNSVFKYNTNNSNVDYIENIDNYLVYQSNIKPGYYCIDDLIDAVKLSTSIIQHGNNYLNNNDIVEQPYLINKKKIGTPHLFDLQIDPINNIVRFVNRMEEINICAMQTFSPYEDDFANNDIFYLYSSNYPEYNLSPDLIYILLPAGNDTTYQYFYNVNCIYTSCAFPLVITNLHNLVGNINFSNINFTVFFDLNIYINNGYSETDLSSICYYKYIDTITINSTVNSTLLTNKYLRFGLHLSTGMLNGNNYNSSGSSIKPSITENIIFSNTIYNYLNNSSSITTNYSVNFNKIPKIGRSLLFRWIFDKYNGNYINYEFNTPNQKKRSILNLLAWPITNKTLDLLFIDYNFGFNFVQTNYQSRLINSIVKNNIQPINDYYNSFPFFQRMALHYDGSKYFFRNSSFIYLKIFFNSIRNNESILDNSIIDGNTIFSIQYNQNYVLSSLLNVGIGEDYTNINNCNLLKIYKKDYNNIFAKILLSPTPGSVNISNSNIVNNNNCYYFYDNMLDNLENISVEVYSSNLELQENNLNFSFTLNVEHDNNVLKETLINTKTNNVSSNGNYL